MYELRPKKVPTDTFRAGQIPLVLVVVYAIVQHIASAQFVASATLYSIASLALPLASYCSASVHLVLYLVPSGMVLSMVWYDGSKKCLRKKACHQAF